MLQKAMKVAESRFKESGIIPFRYLAVSTVLLACTSSLSAARIMTCEIAVDGEVVLEASVVDERGNSDADEVWSCLRGARFRPAEHRSGADEVWPPNQPLTLRGTVELRVRYGGRIAVRRLRLVPCVDEKTGSRGWKLHPADYLATFRFRAMPSEAESAPMSEPVCELPDRPLVIAHRGASGYLPEHTQEATSLAWGMQADIIEQDVVLTRDGVPIVVHDVHLDTVTDIADRYPQRARADGRWYAIDFDLDEIKTLRVNERVKWPSRRPMFPTRFPQRGHFKIATLAELIELIQGLNCTTGRDVGIYPELKQPSWHREQGRDLAKAVLGILNQYGYQSKRRHVFVQCFDADELRRLRDEFNCQLPLIQLLGNDQAPESLWARDSLAKIATYADGIGPPVDRVVWAGSIARIEQSSGVQTAHQMGLVVHPYTIRRDDVPVGFADDFELIDACRAASVDGLFCDFPDRALSALQR